MTDHQRIETQRPMKPTLRFLPSLATILIALFVLTGCASVPTTFTSYDGAAKFPPSDPAKVEVLRADPTRAHVRLGEVQAQPDDTNVDMVKIEAALRQQAAKLGADAAVIVADRI